MQTPFGIPTEELEHRSGARDVLTPSEFESEVARDDYLELYSDVLLRVALNPGLPTAIDYWVAMNLTESMWRFGWTAKSGRRFDDLVVQCQDDQLAGNQACKDAEMSYRIRELYKSHAAQALEMANMIREGLAEQASNVIPLNRRRRDVG